VGKPFPPGTSLPPPAVAEVIVTVTMDMPGVPEEAINIAALASTFQDMLNWVLRDDDLIVRVKAAATGSAVTYTITSVPSPGSNPVDVLATIKADALATATNTVVLNRLVAAGVDTTIASVNTQELVAAMKGTASVSGRVAYAAGYSPPDLAALTPDGMPFPPGVQLSPPGEALPTIGVWEQCGGKGGDCWDKGACIDGFYPGGGRASAAAQPASDAGQYCGCGAAASRCGSPPVMPCSALWHRHHVRRRHQLRPLPRVVLPVRAGLKRLRLRHRHGLWPQQRRDPLVGPVRRPGRRLRQRLRGRPLCE
jgi:hypothetical protein